MWDLPIDLYPGAPPLVQIRGKPATNQPLKQGYIATGSVRVPRRSRAERMRAIAAAHEQLAELYLEEADRLEEAGDIE